MLSYMTWSDYLMILAILVALYYGVILIRFYGKKMRPFLTRKTKDGGQTFAKESTASIQPTPATPPLEMIVDEIRYTLLELPGATGKKDLIETLNQKLAGHTVLQNAPYRDELNHQLRHQAQTLLGIEVTEADLAVIWQTPPS